MNCDPQDEFWDSPAVVSQFSSQPFLFRSERLAFQSCFADGLAGKRVLDLGCGGGRVTRFLKDMGASVVGVDVSQKMVHSARRQHPRIDFVQDHARVLAFKDGSFDLVVFAFNGLDYLYPKEERIKSISEISRVLRQGGLFVFSHHNLAALLFGWFRALRWRKLFFRARHITNGNFFKFDCYLRDLDAPEIVTYYAWPSRVIMDLRRAGFELKSIHPNTLFMEIAQKVLRVDWLTKWTDPWPYYIFQRGALKLDCAPRESVQNPFDL